MPENDLDKDQRCEAASDPECSLSLLVQLARDAIADVRKAAAGNAELPVNIIHELAKDKDRQVRIAAICNRSASMDTIREAAQRDSDSLVRRFAIARDWLTSADELRNLVLGAETDVRVWAALNPSLPQGTLKALRDDPDPLVRDIVLASQPDTPASLVESLASHPDWRVRLVLTLRTSLSLSAQGRLVQDENWEVRESLANNEAIAPLILHNLALDGLSIVRFSAASNPRISRDDLELLSRDSSEVISRLATKKLKTIITDRTEQ